MYLQAVNALARLNVCAYAISLVCDVLLCFCHILVWCPGSGEVLKCIDSRSLAPYLL